MLCLRPSHHDLLLVLIHEDKPLLFTCDVSSRPHMLRVLYEVLHPPPPLPRRKRSRRFILLFVLLETSLQAVRTPGSVRRCVILLRAELKPFQVCSMLVQFKTFAGCSMLRSMSCSSSSNPSQDVRCSEYVIGRY